MAPKSNNMIPNAHFHKKWQRRIKTWFGQPSKKQRQQAKRLKRARKMAPRPTQLFRPAVRCPTIRYQRKLRAGRGFTLEELRRARLCPRFARTIGICVDPRRRNKSVESILLNVVRLNEYKSRLVLFPKGKRRKGDATKEEQSLAHQVSAPIVPIKNPRVSTKARPVTEDERNFGAVSALRKARKEALLAGKRAKKLKEAGDAYDAPSKSEGGRKKKDKN